MRAGEKRRGRRFYIIIETPRGAGFSGSMGGSKREHGGATWALSSASDILVGHGHVEDIDDGACLGGRGGGLDGFARRGRRRRSAHGGAAGGRGDGAGQPAGARGSASGAGRGDRAGGRGDGRRRRSGAFGIAGGDNSVVHGGTTGQAETGEGREGEEGGCFHGLVDDGDYWTTGLALTTWVTTDLTLSTP
jgi:hypothetical protein